MDIEYRVWAHLPDSNGGGWSLVARHLTADEADVYERTFAFRVRVEPDE